MITSCANSKVKRIVALQEKSKNRLKENVFVAEGLKMFEEAPADKIKEIYVEEKLYEALNPDLRARITAFEGKGIPTEIVTKEVFAKMSDTQSPQGILCVMQRCNYQLKEVVENAVKRREKKEKAPLFLLLEDIHIGNRLCLLHFRL